MTHPELVAALVKPGHEILVEMTPDDAHLMHMGIGVCGEAGEILDAIKRRVIYRKDLDFENVIEELGDMEFFLEGVRRALGITREQCLEANIRKLSLRYACLRYSNDQANARADKQ